ncbi:MAG TPA: hypothetical protein IAA58_07630 [Candidatus Gallacutalibacter stercoravium]|nr:hypothetical protein [Candidatus Gallacutalibacter stercoravium]
MVLEAMLLQPSHNGFQADQAGEYQRLISELPGVLNAMFVVAEDGGVQELHILATTRRSPKQVVRDIQSLMLARYGVPLDHRVISVAQIPDPENSAQGIAGRLVLEGTSLATDKSRAEAKVTLSYREENYQGSATAPSAPPGQLRAMAQATIDAVHLYLHRQDVFQLVEVRRTPLASQNAVLVCVSYLRGSDPVLLCGCAMEGEDPYRAAVKAVLSAVNRVAGAALKAE